MNAKIKAKLSKLDTSPGVYFFRNAQGKIIYVGKAANLKNRVRSYFAAKPNINPGDFKTPVLISEIADLEWQTTASEVDALFLESELIKRYRPKFNIDLKDEKSYLYVRIDLNEPHPAVTLVRRPLDDGARYFGPYIAAYGLRQSLRLLRKIFPYNTHTVLPKRVCLQYHLGLCPGLEEDKTPLNEYRANLKKLMMFLRGDRKRLIGQLEREMRLAAKAEDFERAAHLRDQYLSLKSLSRQIIFGDQERFDLSRDQALNGLAKLLGLADVPRRIEAFDVSHVQGTNNTASLIVFLDGVAAKAEYRRFKLRLLGNNDVGHIREVLSRRFSEANLLKWGKPDLVLIDGGKGQLRAASMVLGEYGLELPLMALAKRQETILLPQGCGIGEINLGKDSEVLKLLQRIRDEAHRFAVSYHSLLRSKRQTHSDLEDIPGIGPATRKKLLRRFGSLRAIKQARPSELVGLIGDQKTQVLRRYL